MATEMKGPPLGEGVEGGKVLSIEVAVGDFPECIPGEIDSYSCRGRRECGVVDDGHPGSGRNRRLP